MSATTDRIHKVLLDRAQHLVKEGELDVAAPRPAVRGQLADLVGRYQQQARLDPELSGVEDRQAMVAGLERALCEFGPLTGLLYDRQDVEDIFIRGDQVAYRTADQTMHRLEATATEGQYRHYARKLLERAPGGHNLSERHAIEAVALPGRMRIAVKIPPVVDALVVDIRRFVLRNPTLDALVQAGTLTRPAGQFLAAVLRAGGTVVVAGAAGAGKTTLVDALLTELMAGPEGDSRVVRVAERVRELSAPLNVASDYSRPSGEVDLRTIVVRNLQFSPDLLVVGEALGAEAFEVIRPVNAGVGFLTSVHADSAPRAVEALTNCALLAGENIAATDLRRIMAHHIDCVVFLRKVGQAEGVRRQVAEIVAVESDLDLQGQPHFRSLFQRAHRESPLLATGEQPHRELTRRLEDLLAGQGITVPDLLGLHAAASWEQPA